MNINHAKPIGAKCIRCDGSANVLLEGWTADGQVREQNWICPRCHSTNAISAAGKVVGVAIASFRVVSGAPRGDG